MNIYENGRTGVGRGWPADVQAGAVGATYPSAPEVTSEPGGEVA